MIDPDEDKYCPQCGQEHDLDFDCEEDEMDCLCIDVTHTNLQKQIETLKAKLQIATDVLKNIEGFSNDACNEATKALAEIEGGK
jgi:hypothetical protein